MLSIRKLLDKNVSVCPLGDQFKRCKLKPNAFFLVFCTIHSVRFVFIAFNLCETKITFHSIFDVLAAMIPRELQSGQCL